MTSENPVRLAQANDERALYNLLVEMHAHNDFGWGFPFSPMIVVRHIEEGTRRTDQRSDPRDMRRAAIGVIEEDGRLVATIGLFLDAPMWFVDPGQFVVPTELWFYVSPRARGKGYDKALRDYAVAVRNELRKNVNYRMPLVTGFMHLGGRFKLMQRLWRIMWPKARLVGELFWLD